MGGECNYLLRLSPTTKQLEFVPDHEWKTPCMQSWKDEDIKYVLKEAEKLLLDTAYRLRLPVKVRLCCCCVFVGVHCALLVASICCTCTTCISSRSTLEPGTYSSRTAACSLSSCTTVCRGDQSEQAAVREK